MIGEADTGKRNTRHWTNNLQGAIMGVQEGLNLLNVNLLNIVRDVVLYKTINLDYCKTSKHYTMNLTLLFTIHRNPLKVKSENEQGAFYTLLTSVLRNNHAS